MPWLGRQCSTTVSPGLTVVTPGPISSTLRRGFVAEQMRQEFVGPFGGGDLVELRAADRGVEHLDQHLADAERLRQRDFVDDKRLRATAPGSPPSLS